MRKKGRVAFFFSLACVLSVMLLYLFTPLDNLISRAFHHLASYTPLISYLESKPGQTQIEPGEQNGDTDLVLGSAVQEMEPAGFVVAAIGDIMIHSPQITSAYQEKEGTYDFQENYSYITSHFKKADFVLGNLETTLTGKEDGGFSGYPLFNSPPELAGVLKNSGLDLLITANNHSLDRGAAGITNTIRHLEEAGLDFVGTARSLEEKKEGYFLKQNGIKIAIFAYTYGTNGLPLPPGQDYAVSLMDEQCMCEDIFKAKNIEGADIVIFYMHWGNEYQRTPSDQQKEWARKLIDLGVDVIIGSHPHVVQPAEIVETEKGTGFVFYSLGNFISNQRDRYCDTGVIVYLKIQPDPAAPNTIRISLLEIEPAWVHKLWEAGKWHYRILPVREVLNTEQAQKVFKLTAKDYQRLEEVLQETEETFAECLPGVMALTVSN